LNDFEIVSVTLMGVLVVIAIVRLAMKRSKRGGGAGS
jgi:hypothetical protein